MYAITRNYNTRLLLRERKKERERERERESESEREREREREGEREDVEAWEQLQLGGCGTRQERERERESGPKKNIPLATNKSFILLPIYRCTLLNKDYLYIIIIAARSQSQSN